MKLQWLGQSGYVLESDRQRVVIDPYLSDIVQRKEGLRRLVSPPCTIEDLAPQVLFITHNHLDHYDPDTVPAIMSAFRDCRLISPASVTSHAIRDGISADRLTEIAPGQTIEVGVLRFTATLARHSDPDAVGLLLRTPLECIWFSGDTLYFSELVRHVRELAGRAPDIASICINGRLGNMPLLDAVRTMAELRPRLAIPAHYGMFAENTAAPSEFYRACISANLRAAILDHGQTIETTELLHRLPASTLL